MYRVVADYGVLEGGALWLARAALNPCHDAAQCVQYERAQLWSSCFILRKQKFAPDVFLF